ncbi:MAG: hypothetical protein M1281_15375 [Chloroflexi bacterium]|nr:hypothetical protein [Chloroflexota bacterium]
MNTKKIILCGQNDLLGEVVELFMSSRKGWEVIKISENTTLDQLSRAIQQHHPNAVIYYQRESTYRECSPMELIRQFPELKVVNVGLDNNMIEVYQQKKVWMNSVSDLLSALE